MLKHALAAFSMTALLSVPALAAGRDFVAFDIPNQDVTQAFVDLDNNGHTIKQVALYGDTGSVILYDNNKYWAFGVPAELTAKLDEIAATETAVKGLTFTKAGGYVLLYGQHDTFAKGLDASVTTFLQQEAAVDFNSIVLPEMGGVVVLEANGAFAWAGLQADSKLAQKLTELANQSGQAIDNIIVSPSGGFLMMANGKEIARDGLSDSLTGHIDELSCQGQAPMGVSFLDEDRWFLFY
jgi:hypothetical protein